MLSENWLGYIKLNKKIKFLLLISADFVLFKSSDPEI
jgi:hypothetical protein